MWDERASLRPTHHLHRAPWGALARCTAGRGQEDLEELPGKAGAGVRPAGSAGREAGTGAGKGIVTETGQGQKRHWEWDRGR